MNKKFERIDLIITYKPGNKQEKQKETYNIYSKTGLNLTINQADGIINIHSKKNLTIWQGNIQQIKILKKYGEKDFVEDSRYDFGINLIDNIITLRKFYLQLMSLLQKIEPPVEKRVELKQEAIEKSAKRLSKKTGIEALNGKELIIIAEQYNIQWRKFTKSALVMEIKKQQNES